MIIRQQKRIFRIGIETDFGYIYDRGKDCEIKKGKKRHQNDTVIAGIFAENQNDGTNQKQAHCIYHATLSKKRLVSKAVITKRNVFRR